MPAPPRFTVFSPVPSGRRLLFLALAFLPAAPGAAPAPNDSVFRLAFSDAMFVGINENDARASIRALASAISRERGIPADPEPRLYDGTDQARVAIPRDGVDAIALTTAEYWLLRKDLSFDRFLMAVEHDDPTETYVLLTHRTSAFNRIQDLAGRRLAFVAGPRMDLAGTWLDVALARQGLASASRFFGHTYASNKSSKVILSVFFQQADAAVVNRRAFDTMVELNPQVAREVRVIARSDPCVPSIFAFVANRASPLKQKTLHEFTRLEDSPAGQQLLVIFQSPKIAERPESDLRSAFDLLEEHARRCPEASAARIATLRHRDASAASP